MTGAARRIGRCIALKLAEQGADVVIHYRRSRAEAEQVVKEISVTGRRAIACPAELTKKQEIENLLSLVEECFGRLDILVNNAGMFSPARIDEMTEEQWDTMLDLNLKGAFLTLKHSLPRLMERRAGTVVGISPLGGLVGQPGSAAYAASKWGLRGLLESAALEAKPHGIRVSLVFPHNINSAGRAIEPGSPERQRNLEPEEVASVVAFLCAAPEHVSIGNLTVWPRAAGIAGTIL